MPIIPNITQYVQHLPDALKLYGPNVVSYTRISSTGAGRKNKGGQKETYREKLARDETDLGRRVHEFSGVYPLASIALVESASLKLSRPGLRRAVEEALRLEDSLQDKVILVARDLSRFLRPAASYRINYHADWNGRAAVPVSDDDLDRLIKIARGVPLATLIPPATTEQERHSEITKLSESAGRPRKSKKK